MKIRRKLVLPIVLFLLFVCGCGKEEKKELLDASQERFLYEETEQVSGFTVDEEGRLYTMEYVPEEDKGPTVVTDTDYSKLQGLARQILMVYDLEGNVLEQLELRIGKGDITAMYVDGSLLYVLDKGYISTTSLEQGEMLYVVDMTTWEIVQSILLEGYERIENMVRLGEYFYFIGTTDSEVEETYEEYYAELYKNNVVGRIHLTEQKQELMNISFPVSVYVTDQNSLMLYRYDLEQGFGFLEFTPAENSLVERGWQKEENVFYQLSGCNEDYLFIKDMEYLYFGTIDGELAQVVPEKVSLVRPVVYQKGFAFFHNSNAENCIERICLENVVQDNKTIHLLREEVQMDLPFGCGFRIDNTYLDSEELALKVLAQDKDFDLYFLDSRSMESYNLMKNGAFYALNKVDGVREYLDVCFPYIKDAATNDEGDIWMLPVMMAIPSVVYHKDYCEEHQIDLETMSFAEFLKFTEEVKKEQPAYADLSTYILLEEFFAQYLNMNPSFDTELFRTYAAQLKEIYKRQGEWQFYLDISITMEYEQRVPEFYYTFNRYSQELEAFAETLGESDAVGIMGVPKMAENIRNVGTITFLAVNPKSTNLKATLEYISAYAKYMMTKQDSFMLADESNYTDTPFRKDWYELYANGAVSFDMDGEVYWELFNEYLKGEVDLETAIAEMERRRKLYLEE